MTYNLPYEIAKLLKIPENRLCADCHVPISSSTTTIQASLRYCIWIWNTNAVDRINWASRIRICSKSLGINSFWVYNVVVTVLPTQKNYYERYITFKFRCTASQLLAIKHTDMARCYQIHGSRQSSSSGLARWLDCTQRHMGNTCTQRYDADWIHEAKEHY